MVQALTRLKMLGKITLISYRPTCTNNARLTKNFRVLVFPECVICSSFAGEGQKSCVSNHYDSSVINDRLEKSHKKTSVRVDSGVVKIPVFCLRKGGYYVGDLRTFYLTGSLVHYYNIIL